MRCISFRAQTHEFSWLSISDISGCCCFLFKVALPFPPSPQSLKAELLSKNGVTSAIARRRANVPICHTHQFSHRPLSPLPTDFETTKRSNEEYSNVIHVELLTCWTYQLLLAQKAIGGSFVYLIRGYTQPTQTLSHICHLL